MLREAEKIGISHLAMTKAQGFGYVYFLFSYLNDTLMRDR
jgi:hypothetical protein